MLNTIFSLKPMKPLKYREKANKSILFFLCKDCKVFFKKTYHSSPFHEAFFFIVYPKREKLALRANKGTKQIWKMMF